MAIEEGSDPSTALTDTQLRAAPVPVSGTQTDALTDMQLRAAPVPVSGTQTDALTDMQLRAAPVPVSGPLTDTQLRAAPVPVSGPLTDTQLRAAPVPVSGKDSAGFAQPLPVNTRADALPALDVADDMKSSETFRQVLVASTDTPINFTQPVRLVRVKNESLVSAVFVAKGAIASDDPANAEMVGVAPALNLPNAEYHVFKTSTIHLRSAGTPKVSITGFF